MHLFRCRFLQPGTLPDKTLAGHLWLQACLLTHSKQPSADTFQPFENSRDSAGSDEANNASDFSGVISEPRFVRHGMRGQLRSLQLCLPVLLLFAKRPTLSMAQEPFDCWEKARLDPKIDASRFAEVRTVFGYGSLIFRPGFPYRRKFPARVRGYLRRFWQRSCDHRGTPDFPGRVMALLRAEDVDVDGEGEVCGMAFEVEASDWPEVLAALDIRERHGYTRTLTTLHSLEGPGELGEAVVYYVHEPQQSAAYTGPEALDATAAVIAAAKGPSGPNDEYLFSLLEALKSQGLPEDAYLTSLRERVRDTQKGG